VSDLSIAVAPGSSLTTPRQRFLEEIATIAEAHGVTPGGILGHGRKARIVNARNAAYWYVWYKHGYSLLKLGRLFNRTHSAVLFGIGCHMKRCGIDHKWVAMYDRRNQIQMLRARKEAEAARERKRLYKESRWKAHHTSCRSEQLSTTV
jgi:hypothetical protein